MNATDINCELISVNGENVMSVQIVQRWRKQFLEGHQDVHDEACSGWPSTVTTDATFEAVLELVEENLWFTISDLHNSLSMHMEISRSSIGKILKEDLDMHKVCTRWVPCHLTDAPHTQWMGASLMFLSQYTEDGDYLISRIVTGDKTWVHHHTHEIKRQSMVWKRPGESAPKKCKVVHSAGKVIWLQFFRTVQAFYW